MSTVFTRLWLCPTTVGTKTRRGNASLSGESQKLFLTVSTSTSRRRSSPAGLATGAQPYRSTIGRGS